MAPKTFPKRHKMDPGGPQDTFFPPEFIPQDGLKAEAKWEQFAHQTAPFARFVPSLALSHNPAAERLFIHIVVVVIVIVDVADAVVAAVAVVDVVVVVVVVVVVDELRAKSKSNIIS